MSLKDIPKQKSCVKNNDCFDVYHTYALGNLQLILVPQIPN